MKAQPSFVRVVKALKAYGSEMRAQSGGGLMAQCPAHPDGNPSLSVQWKPKDGTRDSGTVLHCFAGCEVSDILREIGLRMADLFDVRPGEEETPQEAHQDDQDGDQDLNWRQVWDTVRDGADWLVYPLLERGRATTIYAPAGEGKSLVSLEIAAALAAGRDVLGQPVPRTHVVYWDYENDVPLIVNRLKSMAYSVEDIEKHLHYRSFPSGVGLDDQKGAEEIIASADKHAAKLVVIDTYATSVDGEENSADTARGFAKYVVGPLKSRGIASLRLDHTGKDVTKGERGTSAKRGDVDYSWLIQETSPNAFTFKNTKNRPGHAPKEFYVMRKDIPHLHHDVEDDLLAGMDPVGRIVAQMDSLDLPLNITRDQARAAGVEGTNAHISEAIKIRKARANGDSA